MENVVNTIGGFNTWSHVEKIKFFGWYLHSREGKDFFTTTEIRECYDRLNLSRPANISQQLTTLSQQKPSVLLKRGGGYKLEKGVRDSFESQYGTRQTSIQIHTLLSTLPSKIPNIEERSFLDEAIKCLKAGASRAAIVMCWNLAFDHLCGYVVQNHLDAFNVAWPKCYQKKHKDSAISTITKRDDFEIANLQESEVIAICKSATIITPNTYKVLKEKLDRRNIAAHPNATIITPLQAEDFITDLVNNVVLVLQ